ncbi:hypothetical protein F3Y22_tig00002793pilonHSYRG00325 [Hibiscus syriacus]|uniref:Uncharacterized protein n=1 Tax=Hibiscus syriacus TaxID=106335 RepID=A0A6A3CWM4_HIBSY|nr:uncharacterized protein LOC120150840 [Hibiscus syriacus]KAE8731698.1 hypothetical protein F3Y22_tig00002793pilonHSYRG00325 [Hibiscus syriacus]
MKKMKGIAVPAAVKEYSPYIFYEDQRARFRYPSHMEEFEDLHKETESVRKKLQMMKEKRSTLLAEVKFLKRRHKFLMQNQSWNTPSERHFLQPQNMVIQSKSNMKAKKSTGKGASPSRAMGFDLNQKGKTNSVKGTDSARPSLVFDLNQKQQKSFGGKEETNLRSSLSVLDLNQKERFYSGKEATARSMKPIFDLNQISREEEELETQTNSVRIEEFKKSSIRIGSEEQHNDTKISACRNTGNGPNRSGKRKISWQDQVALRV